MSARQWKPSSAIKASIALHSGVALGALIAPALWPWALGTVAFNQGMLVIAGMLPRSTLLGPNKTRLPAASVANGEIALTFDDGPDPAVTPRVLDHLDAAGARASFFCIGRRARAHPALCREIVARGHRVENHGYAHTNTFACFGLRRIRADIEAAQMALGDITGQAPRYFRPTAGLRNPLLEPALCSLGLELAAWTRRPFDTREGRPATILARLTKRLSAGDILLMHDGNSARSAAGNPVILEVLPQFLNICAYEKLRSVSLAYAFAERS